jgi:hypothetical protein
LWITVADDHPEKSVEDVDGFVEVAVEVWWGAGELRWHGQLADGQTEALAEYL